jgi:hypothetical protein
MKKLTILFLLIIFSCSEKNNKIEEQPKRKIDLIFDEISKKYKNFEKNPIASDDLKQEFDKKIDSLDKLGILDKYLNDENVNLKIWKIFKNPYGDGAIIQLYVDDLDDGNRFKYDIVGLMDKNKASKIEAMEGEPVFIQGKKMKRLNEAEASILPVQQYYYNNKTEINRKDNIEIGNYIMEIDSLF